MVSARLWAAMLAGVSTLLAQTPEVTLHLSPAGGKTSFRLGETIELELSFTSTAEKKYVLTNGSSNRDIMENRREEFRVSPAAGASDPLADYFKSGGGSFISGAHDLSTTPFVIKKDLNQWLRFDRPGSYRLRAISHRVALQGKPVDVESNEIELELIDDPAWRTAEAAIAAEMVRSTPNRPESWAFQRRMAAAHELWYLDTPEAARESARLMDGSDDQLDRTLLLGLMASSRKRAAVESMQALLADPSQPVSLTFVSTLAWLKAWLEFPDTNKTDSARMRQERIQPLEKELISQLAAVMERKDASAKPVSLRTLALSQPVGSIAPGERAQLAAVFSSLPPDKQREFLGGYWYRISGPAMLPVLRKIYDALPDTVAQQSPQQELAGSAVQRLYELDPVEGRRILLSEIARPVPRLPGATLSMLPDADLPDLDDTLAANLETNTSPDVEKLIARYATPRILPRVRAVYARIDTDRRGRKEPVGDPPRRIASTACEPPLYAYFLRTDPNYGGQLLHAVMAERSFEMGRCWLRAIGETARYYVNAQWESVALDGLNDSTVPVKIDAVTALGKYGSPAALSHLWETFQYWHDWWKAKPAEINEENRRLEGVYTQTFQQASNWIATGDDLRRASALCITDGCRRLLDGSSRYWSATMPVSLSQAENGEVYANFAQYSMPSLAEARRRLLQLPKGIEITWKVTTQNNQPSLTLNAWVAEMETELAKQGVTVVR